MSPGLLDPHNDAFVDMIQPVNIFHPLNRGLIAWWLALPGTMGSSRFMDIVSPGPNGNHGTLTNMDPATDWVASNRPGGFGALNFTAASSHYVNVGGGDGSVLDLTDDMTIALWIKMNGDYTSIQGVVSNLQSGGSGCSYQLEFGRTNNEFSWLQSGAAIDSVSSVALADDNWHHVLVTRKGVTGNWDISWYFDGVFDETDNTAGNSDPAPGTTSIGRPGEFNGQYFNGLIDDVHAYNRALSASELSDLYHLSQQVYPGMLNRWRRRTYSIPAAAGGRIMSSLAAAGGLAGVGGIVGRGGGLAG